jgi:hypothetical protein
MKTIYTQIISVIFLTISAGASVAQPSQAQDSVKFLCGVSRGVPVTFVRTPRGDKPIIRWVDKAFSPPWNPEERCTQISERFQQFYNNGTLRYLRTGIYNRQNVLCVASYQDGPCLPNGVLVTLKPGSDSKLTLERLQDFQGLSGGKAIYLSGSANGATYLNMNQFINEIENPVKTPSSCPAGKPAWEC